MNPVALKQRSENLKRKARELGFSFCGISAARRLDEEEDRLSNWLQAGHHGTMLWMEKHFDMRLDPRQLVPGAKSVVSLLYNYHNPEGPSHHDAPKVATYAYGRDYHKVVKKKLFHLLRYLEEETGAEINARAFVDSAPVMERQWAALSGLGWTGKNTLLINKNQGSWFFLAELILDLDFEYDGPVKDHCGTCTACIDACPTGAITPYQVAAEKCISYLTIELKESIPPEFGNKMENWVFGCDICQEVCPWNRFARPHSDQDLFPRSGFLNWERKDWQEMDEKTFEKMFHGTPLKRAGYRKVQGTAKFLS